MTTHNEPANIRNVAIVGHASSGKTMLAEAMLTCSGAISRMGNIAEGTTVSDYHVSEKQRQISVQTALLHTEWMGKKLNILDTPGYLDFVGEVLGALRVADFALVVIHAQHGIGVGTERTWNYASQQGIPKILVVNAVDKQNEHFEQVLADARSHYGKGVFPLNIPINPGPGFNQVLDVLRNEILTYQPNDRGKYREEPAQGPWKDRVTQLHKELIEHIAESEDALLTKFFEKGGLTEEEFRSGIHTAVQKQHFIPLFCVSAQTDVGVARLLDFIAKYGSSPVDRSTIQAQNTSGAPVTIRLQDAEPVVHVFKTMSEAHFGELSFFRIYSGTVRPGMDLFNSDRNITERIGPLYILNGRERSAVHELRAGDIGATVKLKDTHTGNTLSSPKRPIVLPRAEYPGATIHAALQSGAKGEEDKIAAGLAALHQEDPTFIFRVDSELHQTIISAQGELHLEVLVERLQRRFNVHVSLAEPKVPYRETIKSPSDSKYRHKKQTGGAGQFAEVWMRISPAERDSGVEFTQSLSGQNVDRVYVPAVERGVQTACHEGILGGYKVVDVKVDFYEGKMHAVDSNDISFQIAGYFAFKDAFAKARSCLLEPIHDIEVRIPEDYLGKVMGDLSSRRGRILGVDVDGQFQVIKAQVPARELYRYSSNLRSLTGGRGIHSEKFSHYEEMPQELEQRVIEESRKRNGERKIAA
ncbi:MAG: small GTP-binding protein [Verrucomicrobiales bacterium]|nr:small GTP-binding protein [Verrucomicrobiales bacterium]